MIYRLGKTSLYLAEGDLRRLAALPGCPTLAEIFRAGLTVAEMQPPAPELPDIRDVPGLLLAAQRGDADGAAAIIEASEPAALALAVAAWCNIMHGRADFDDDDAWVDYLQHVAAAMAARPPDDGESGGGLPVRRAREEA